MTFRIARAYQKYLEHSGPAQLSEEERRLIDEALDARRRGVIITPPPRRTIDDMLRDL